MKRTKTVFPTGEIAHLWANQLQTEARNSGGNLYFNGRTIYSYGAHFPIATISDTPGTVLFTTRKYSNTTAKHISYVQGACSHKDIIYCYNPEQAYNGIHGENIKNFEAIARNISNSLVSAKKPQKYIDQISRERNLFEKYCAFFKLNVKKVIKDYQLYALFTESKEHDSFLRAKAAKDTARRNKKRQAMLQKQWETQIKEWRAHERHEVTVVNGNTAILRISEDETMIETSKGIRIPRAAAERFYKWTIRKALAGGCVGNCGHTILGYAVSEVTDESFTVGCHTITMAEARDIAIRMNWLV